MEESLAKRKTTANRRVNASGGRWILSTNAVDKTVIILPARMPRLREFYIFVKLHIF